MRSRCEGYVYLKGGLAWSKFNTEDTGNKEREMDTYQNRQFLANFRRYKPQNHPADRDSNPICRGAHTGWKWRRAPNQAHELHNPTAHCHFHSDINEQEERTDPGNLVAQRFTSVSRPLFRRLCILFLVFLRRLRPEGRHRRNQFHKLDPDHEVVELVPT